jgi:putative thioredoxin
MLIGQAAAPGANKPASAHIKEGSDASFAADVIEASMVQPVIVDFWATWCGPCKTLGPALEQAVEAAGGKVKLVKIDVDKNPAYAGQLKVQSIPTVYGFVGGQPVDGFMGAVPGSQLKAFIDKLIAAGGGAAAPGADAEAPPIDEILAMGAESMGLGDIGGAAQAYAHVLQLEPANIKAMAGLARAYLAGGDVEGAQEIVAMAPAGTKDLDLDGVKAALKLAAEGPSDTVQFEQKLAADPDDHQARFDLAAAHAAAGRWPEAIDHLLRIIEKDLEWGEGAARKQLLTVFEAAGPGEAVKQGRRRLSAVLFS